MEKKALYERYQMLADKKRVSNYKVAKDTEIAQETLSSWKKGKYTPKLDKIEKLADYFGVSPDFFYDGSVIETCEVSAGNGRINSCSETFKPSSGRYAKVVGDSMYPTLHDGDFVKIVETTDVTPSDFALVRINGDEVTIKHVEVTDDGMWIRAENKEVFEDKFYTIKDIVLLPVQIVGKATEIIQRKL